MIAQLPPLLPQPFLPGYTLPPVPQNATRILLLRHGRSTLNDAGRYQGSADLGELTHQGFMASRAIGCYLRDCPIDAVYASPLRRAQDTVAALLPDLKNPIVKRLVTSDLLKEIHLPAWEGLKYEDVRSHQPDLYRCWQQTPDLLAMPCSGAIAANAPSFYPVQDLYDRAHQFWKSILPHHRGQTILIVSHGSTNQALINTALHLPARQHHALQQTHSGLTVLDVSALGTPAHLHILNLTLGDGKTTPPKPRLPKLKAGKQGIRLVLVPCQLGQSPSPTLKALLADAAIQAAIIEDSHHSSDAQHHTDHRVIQTLLNQHPETVVLSVRRSRFWSQWQTAIQGSLKTQSHDGLTTLLAIAQPSSLTGFLKTLLSLSPNADALTLQPDTLSVVHYPHADVRPILQSINLLPR